MTKLFTNRSPTSLQNEKGDYNNMNRDLEVVDNFKNISSAKISKNFSSDSLGKLNLWIWLDMTSPGSNSIKKYEFESTN